MRIAFGLGALAALVFAASAFAGTMSYTYNVVSFERISADRARVLLRAQPPSGDQLVSPCREIAATIAYRPEFFLRQTWSRTLTRTAHREALVALDGASQDLGEVQFGVFDALTPDAQGRCTLELRGLDLMPDNQIVGFNRPI